MTIKTNTRFPFFLLIYLSFLLFVFACRFFSLKPSGLQLDKSADDGSVSGSYRYSKELGKEIVRFSVSKDGLASFQLEDSPESKTLTVDYSSQDKPNMSWQGGNLDGMGGLSVKEKALLDNLYDSNLAHGLAMIPLDVACEGDESPDPAQMAALLYPLQMRFKYQVTDRAAEASEMLALSQCNYGNADKDTGKSSSIIMMTPSNPVPVVLGYFPFDEVGAVEASTAQGGTRLACMQPANWPGFTSIAANSPLLSGIYSFGADPIENEWGPCNAKCRGACGPDCTHDNCKFSIEERCEKNQEGDNSGFFSLVNVYDCGLHPACIEHDACYDDCNRRHGCGSWAATFCMHGMTLVSAPLEYFSGSHLSCDSATLLSENPTNVKDWVRGYGPQPSRQVFEYHNKELSYEYDTVTCPLKEDDGKEEKSTEEAAPAVDDDTPVTTYIGSGNWYSEKREGKMESMTSKIIISVTEDGAVKGSLKFHDVELTYHNTDDDCTGHWEHWIDGTISGQLEDGSGVITFSQNVIAKNITACPEMNPGYNVSLNQLADVKIDGDTLSGATQPDPEDPEEVWGFTFTAAKQ